MADVIDQERAARAALIPAWVEHEVIHDELAASAEQIEQAHLACWAIEDVVLLDPDHRQPAAFGVDRVAVARQFLFFGEQLLARAQPIGTRYDLGIFWGSRIFFVTHDQVASFDLNLPSSALTLNSRSAETKSTTGLPNARRLL